MNEILTKIVADLFARSQGSEELSSHIIHLRNEIKKVTEHEEGIYGKFRGLLESFREVIPEEKQRYQAAIKALSTTSKLSQQEIVKALGGKLEELKILEKSLLSPLPGWHEELKAMDARAMEKREQIAKLREQIALLETEEEAVRKGKDARERIMGLAEKAMKELFTDIGKEIASIKKSAEELGAESAPAQPVPQSVPQTRAIPAATTGSSEKSGQVQDSPPTPDTGLQKKCPMCGGQMNLHTVENTWMCYSCAYEEANQGMAAGGGKQHAAVPEPSAAQTAGLQKKCPMCGGKMDFLINEHMWQCYSCAYEEDGKDEAKGKTEMSNAKTPPLAVPVEELSSNEPRETKKRSATKTKTCPSCRKKMFWFPDEKAWRCPFCRYETRELS